MYRYFHYTKYFKQAQMSANSYDKLMDLFRNLLLQTNGDVNEALHWMTALNNRYNFTEDLSGFFEKLKEEGLISEQNNVFIMTSFRRMRPSIRATAEDLY